MISKIRLYKEVNVVIYFSKNNKELRHYTGVKVEPEFFDSQTGAIKAKGDFKTLANDLNKRILTEKSRIDNLILSAPSGVDLVAFVKDKLTEENAVTQNTAQKLTVSLLDYYGEFYAYKEKEVQRGKLKKQSIKDYKSLYNALIDYTNFNKQWVKSYKIKLDNINEDWLYKFKDFLKEKRINSAETQYLTKGGLIDTTLTKRFDSFKAFFSYLIDKKVCFKNEALDKFSVYRGETDIIIITKDEEKAIIEHIQSCSNLEHIKLLKIALVLINTGMRYSDAESFNKRLHLKEVKTKDANGLPIMRKVIGKVAVKTITSKNNKGIFFEVPLNQIAEKYLAELDWKLKHYKNLQSFNEQIKLALKEIEIFKEPYELANGEVFEKWSLISSHNFRKSFITNCVMNNVPLHIIMGMTSHRKMDTLNVYVQKFGHNNTFSYVDSI